MHVVIGGFGRVGRYLARQLEESGHTVAVIDHDAESFAAGAHELKGRRLQGEIIDRDTLLKAGIEKADAFAALTSGDNSNIVAARIARERFGVKIVVARIYDPRRAVIYQRLGIPTISSVQWASSRLLEMIEHPGVTLEDAYGGGEVMTIEVVADRALSGRRVIDIEYPEKLAVTCLVRNGTASIPTGRTEVVPGDILHLTIMRDSVAELDALLGSKKGRL
ncbi:MAG: TrkA family potassium uptake protein [Actinomycetota bacterium]|nr:TrkA family potassium uptake protein [Actinomycetota bacterium]